MLNFSFNNKVILNLNRMCILKKRFLAKRFFFFRSANRKLLMHLKASSILKRTKFLNSWNSQVLI